MPSRSAVLILALTSLTHPLPTSAATHFVDLDATGANDGSSWTDAHVDLKDALTVAQHGDEVWIAEGTYFARTEGSADDSFVLVDGVALYGGFAGDEIDRESRDPAAHPTVLADGADAAVPYCILVGTDLGPGTLVDGLEVRGRVPGSPSSIRTRTGVCLAESEMVFRDVVFEELETDRDGPALSIVGGRVTFERTAFRRNLALRDGGALSIEGADVIFLECELWNNQAARRGGALIASNASVEIIGGRVSSNRGDSAGGAISLVSSTLRLEGVELERNGSGSSTSAVSAQSSELLVVDCRFSQNIGFANVPPDEDAGVKAAPIRGAGGVLELSDCDALVVDSEFRANAAPTGGALNLGGGHLTAVNCAFVGNEANYGGFIAAFAGARVEIVNSIARDHTTFSGGPDVYVEANAELWFAHSIVEGSRGSGPAWDAAFGLDLGGNLDVDPDFVVAGTDASSWSLADLHLLLSSPAIDAGTDPGAYLPADFDASTDLDGNPRLSGNRIDMGPHEYQFDGCPTARVDIGPSWDGIPLQEIFDATYGPGAIDAATGYSGYACGDPLQAYWHDTSVSAWLVREIASNGHANVFGWHVEDFEPPIIDGIADGVIFDGPVGDGATAMVSFPSAQRFGFYLDPNGPGDATNAPHPEHFFANRFHDDAGADGSGAPHQPAGGDVQCLIYDISHLRHGAPSYVLAWEELDAGSPVTATYTPTSTDNDYNDLVVEIQAESPVGVVVARLEARSRGRAVELHWELKGTGESGQYEIQRRPAAGTFATIATSAGRQWVDDTLTRPGRYDYRIAVRLESGNVYSEVTSVDFAPGAGIRSALLRAVPNPFNPATRIEYVLAERGDLTLRIFDLAGREVRHFELRARPAGPGAIEWDGTDSAGRSVATGSYIVQMVGASTNDELRVVLIK